MNKKNVLILIDTCLNYVNFFKDLSSKIESQVNCYYACESHFPEIRSNSMINSNKKFYYSEYKIKNESYNIDIKKIDEKFNLRRGYFPDFDRHEWFNIRRDLDKRADYEIISLINFFIKIIKENNIDYIIYENVSNIYSYSAYVASEILKKKYIGFIVSRMPGTHDIWFDIYGNIDKIDKDFWSYNEDKIRPNELKFINQYYENIDEKKPEYLKNDIKSYNINYFNYYLKKINLVKRYVVYTIKNKEDRKNSIGMDNPISISFKSIKRNINRKFKIKYLNTFRSKFFDVVDSKDEYILYPLHFQPESSTSVNAMYFVNQYETIKNIAFSLPLGMTLYVKDHPHAFGYFSLEFYKSIKRIPNVKLIHCDENTNKLIRNMKFLITLTGTMGYESLLLKKPVISFGNVSYKVHPYCYNIDKYEDIFETVKKVLKNQHNDFDEFNKRLIYAYKKNIYDGVLVMYDYKRSDMNLIADNLLKVFREDNNVH